MNETDRHRPVLVQEVLDLLTPRSGGTYVDGTVGDGGHARAILEAAQPEGRLLGLDRDPQALERAGRALEPWTARIELVHASYRELGEVLARLEWDRVDGVLLDLGVSTLQLIRGSRGFSVREDGPIDMRMDPTTGASASELLGQWDEAELARVLRELGEERFARRIARSILRARDEDRLQSTSDLAEAVRRSVPPSARYGRIHPATRAFQALRIATNAELDHLQAFLSSFVGLLRPSGTVAILTYHSLEDRLVKRAFREAARRGEVVDLAKRPLRPSDAEVADNPRARSAKLRAVRRVA